MSRSGLSARSGSSANRRTGCTPLLVDLWEEISRLFPDGSYVTRLRLLTESGKNERWLELAGFADGALKLPELLEKSPLFVDASLTAPVTPNPVVNRESFALHVKIRRSHATQ